MQKRRGMKIHFKGEMEITFKKKKKKSMSKSEPKGALRFEHHKTPFPEIRGVKCDLTSKQSTHHKFYATPK